MYNSITNNRHKASYNYNKESYKEIRHLTINYIDDSTSVIAHKNHKVLSCYLTQYYTLLHDYYTANKLLVNNDKTELLVTCTKPLRIFSNKVKLNANNYEFLQKQSTKTLGFIITNNLNTIIS